MTCPKCNNEVHEDSQGVIACLSCGYHESINQVRDTAIYNNKDLMKRDPATESENYQNFMHGKTNDAGEKLQYSTSFCNTCKEVTQDGKREAEDGTKWCTSCLSYKDGRMRVGTISDRNKPISDAIYEKAMERVNAHQTNDAGEKLQSTEDTLTQRGTRYGEFRDHAILSQKLKNLLVLPSFEGTEAELYMYEAMEMICHKLARIANGDPLYDDSWRDIAGYAELVVKELNRGK
jgi:DNA-directed RNA polymerase subunit M/transcription elongation factor TFIIS